MTTTIFVHGIGVRDAAYELVLPALAGGLTDRRPDTTLEFLYWGAEYGARTVADNPALPEDEPGRAGRGERSEEHTSELQSRENLVCRLLLEKKKQPTQSGAPGRASSRWLRGSRASSCRGNRS